MIPNTLQIAENIRAKNFEDAEKTIIEFIENIAYKSERIEVSMPKVQNIFEAPKINKEELLYAFLNQFAALLTELFTNKDYQPSEAMIGVFLSQKYVVDSIFTSSFWNNTDSLIDHLGIMKLNKSGQTNLTEQNLTLLLMLVTISSKYKLPWGNILKSMPAKGLSAYIGLITQHVPSLSKENNSGYNHLLESAKDLPIFELPVLADLGKLAYSFFACSYATTPEKYEFKKWMTKTLRSNITQWLTQDIKNKVNTPKVLEKKEKLKIVVMLEMYNDNHAMFRCFNNLLSNLSNKHDIIACYQKESNQELKLDIFSKSIVITDIFDINSNVKSILDESPDIVLYPSIGMKFWTTYLSQLRLAPLQMMTGGHPSSSQSPNMDYFLIVGNSFSAEDLQPFVSEKVIVLDDAEDNYVQHTLHSEIDDNFISLHNHFIEEDEHIKIAINGVMTKVTYAIIDVCKKIEAKANKKITFIFFSRNEKDHISYLSCKKQLSKMLKSTELKSYHNYVDYMETISQCHFLLPTIPFGGSNSNVDAMILNKPKLFLKGKEHLYTRTDQCEWDRVGLVDEFGCESVDELVNKSVEYVNNKEKRKTSYELMIASKCVDKTFNHGNDDYNILTRLIDTAINDHMVISDVKQFC